MLSYRAWQQQYGSDPSVIGSSFIFDGHPVTIVGISPPGFFGETLRSDPPEIWVPLQQEPLFRGKSSLLHQFPGVVASDWPAAPWRLGRRRCPQRLTSLLRNWLVTDSGMPADWLTGIKAGLPKQNITSFPPEPGWAR